MKIRTLANINQISTLKFKNLFHLRQMTNFILVNVIMLIIINFVSKAPETFAKFTENSKNSEDYIYSEKSGAVINFAFRLDYLSFEVLKKINFA